MSFGALLYLFGCSHMFPPCVFVISEDSAGSGSKLIVAEIHVTPIMARIRRHLLYSLYFVGRMMRLSSTGQQAAVLHLMLLFVCVGPRSSSLGAFDIPYSITGVSSLGTFDVTFFVTDVLSLGA